MSTRASIALTAFETLRSNPMHTFMSIIGLVIGVAALVGVLALGDGMEQFAREQIDATTDLKIVSVSPRTVERIDGVLIKTEDPPELSIAAARSLQSSLQTSATVVYYVRRAVTVSVPNDTLQTAAYAAAATESASELMRGELLAGRSLDRRDVDESLPVVVVNSDLGARIRGRSFGSTAADSSRAARSLIGRTILIDSLNVEIVGVVESAASDRTGALLPISLPGVVPADSRPALAVKAALVEQVPAIKHDIRTWADGFYTDGAAGLNISSNEMRVDQAQRAVRLFKVIMALITGISVIVGGVGVMNVLLMAITERTREIGVRMAAGARRKDIVFQFLIESVTISAAGSLAGLLTGLVAVFAFTPVIRKLTEVPFQAGFSWGSLLIVLLIAAVIGIVFGTYPAYRAARLNPVDAIRYE